MKKKDKTPKQRNLNILANIMMILGFIMILIPLIGFIMKIKISSDISLIGIVIGLIGIFISRKINKN